MKTHLVLAGERLEIRCLAGPHDALVARLGARQHALEGGVAEGVDLPRDLRQRGGAEVLKDVTVADRGVVCKPSQTGIVECINKQNEVVLVNNSDCL